VTHGEIRFVLDGAPTILYAGDLCLVRRGQRFSYSNESAESASLVLVHTPPFDIAEEVFV
jgi:mannose-6-phosphate isomerase-like protein (cupin superfamily)